jgi:hypothetical protein
MDDPELLLTIMAPAPTADSRAKLRELIDLSKSVRASPDGGRRNLDGNGRIRGDSIGS